MTDTTLKEQAILNRSFDTEANRIKVTNTPSGLDSVSGKQVVIDFPHHKEHDGDAYLAWDREDLSNAQVFNYSLITPDTTKWVHFILEAISEKEMFVQMWEAATLTAGTALTAYNKNRNSSTTAKATVTSTPTSITTGSVLLMEDQWGSGKEGGGSRGLEEFILKQNTKYLIRFTNLTANANFLSVHFNWYEHTSVS